MKFTVKVPATSANMGPGFDCLGIALELYNEFTVEESSHFSMEIKGEGEHVLALDRGNLFYRAFSKVFTIRGKRTPIVKISCFNEIPLARGLGSSSSAIAGGLMAANHLVGNPMSREELLTLAIDMEGHGDNVTPALFGGCQIVLKQGDAFVHYPVPAPARLKAVLFIPDFTMSTAKGRSILPARVSRSDAVFNIGRTALLVLALSTGKIDYLRVATEDMLHQPARKALFPAMDRLFRAALDGGADGAYLSGSGSTVMALSDNRNRLDNIAGAMEKAAAREKIDGKSRIVSFASTGAEILGKC